MAGAEIGGDSSVQWSVVADHVRGNPAPGHGPFGPGGWKHTGIDETGLGAQNGFFISLKMPRNANDAAVLVNTLMAAAASAQANAGSPGFRVNFTLPIELQSTDQILIDWHSTPLAPGRIQKRFMKKNWGGKVIAKKRGGGRVGKKRR